MSNIVLELREKDSLNVNNENGHYIANLSQEISINQGDTISLKQAFIDTTDESPQNITIDKDITLIFNYCPYTMDWKSDTGAYITNTGANTSSRRGRPRLPYKKIPPELIPNYSFVNNVEFVYYSNLPAGKGVDSTSYQAIFSYTNTLNQTQYLPLTIPQLSDPKQKKPNFPSNVKFNPNIIAKNGSFQIVSPSLQNQQLNGAIFNFFSPILTPAEETQTQYKPYEMRWEIPVSAGTYNINDLLLTISKNLAENSLDYKAPNITVLRNPVLFRAGQFSESTPQPDESLIKRQNVNNPNVPEPTPIPEPVLFCEAYDETNNTIPTAQFFKGTSNDVGQLESDWFLGTNQVQFSFNEQTGKCEMNYLHMPIYSTNGGDISCRYVFLPDLAPGSPDDQGLVIAVSSNGGIVFSGLSAEDSDGNYIDFFENTLGFDLQSLVIQFAPPIPNLFGKTDCQFIPFIPLIEGQNITTGYVGADTLVRKGNNRDDWLACPKASNPTTDIPLGDGGYQSTIDPDTTVKIEAVEQLAVLLSDFSHFLIDIKSNFMTDLVGSNYYRTISAIVSKYQSYTSFTYGESDGAISYTHKGNSVLLKSLEIKILKSDKTSATSEIGNDNTIYLEIIKS
jgi:hypothetical protein